jgi:hypothetical protein
MESNVAELEKETSREPSVPPQEPERQNTPSRWADPKFRRAFVWALAVVGILIITLIWYYHNRVSTDDAEVDGHLVPMACKIYGDIAEVRVDDNQLVKAGQVLVRIDPRDYQARVDQAKGCAGARRKSVSGSSGGRAADPGNDAKLYLLSRRAVSQCGGGNTIEPRQLTKRIPPQGWLSRGPMWTRGKLIMTAPRLTLAHEAPGGRRRKSRSNSSMPTWRARVWLKAS